ncbi:DUF421 domain-containing protein [Acetohalobium arabaticum]|uniref:DUF421 domain-containing protein n=1 Tax=Acetohalobium arabaticum (strain ATCC 49924 / DSM 5501 / Z-7288) TaxID=574087 RepID=D9QQT6_ACEAZ|nr:DUF421 domain-containing protein [Acetohalobium arabaticum]ADL12877.1 protein of unknown function DUF421 [Acetohalobium arabaticum DSM 5501]
MSGAIIFEIIIQTFLAFFAILFYTRILGKQQIGELSFHDYVNGITFGSIAATMTTDFNQRTWHYLLGLTLFAALTFLMQLIVVRSRKARKVIEGEPIVLIHNGKILEKNMKTARFNLQELTSHLRQKDIFDLKQVEYAILEPNGNISVMPKPEHKSVTVKDMGLSVSPEAVPTAVITDGKLLLPNLKQHGLSKTWIKEQLKAYGIEKIEEVFMAAYDPVKEELYIDLYEDNLGKNTVDMSEEYNTKDPE